MSFTYKVSGLSLGFASTNQFSDHLLLNMSYKLHSSQNLEINSLKDQASFINIAANVMYNF